MMEFTESIRIEAPMETVWALLADIGTIADWNPGPRGSHRTNDKPGLGATRFCDIDGRNTLDERIVHFDPGRAITFRITRSTLPFRDADIRFELARASGETEVKVSPIYVLKFGFFGRILDAMFVARAYRKGMQGLLGGLKSRAETSQEHSHFG